MNRLENISFLDLSDRQIKVLLGDKANIKYILSAAQQCNQIRSLMRHLILNPPGYPSEEANEKKTTSDWESKQWEERVQEAFLDRRRDSTK